MPAVVDEGPTWVTVDGNHSSGYYTLNIMADKAIEKAREYGIAIAFGGNHNDAGSFARYVFKAFEQDAGVLPGDAAAGDLEADQLARDPVGLLRHESVLADEGIRIAYPTQTVRVQDERQAA